MKKNWDYIAGIDISKKTFDVAVGLNIPNVISLKASFSNNLQGFDNLLRWFRKHEFDYDSMMICLENTGIYHRLLAQYLHSQNIIVWVETPVQIKWSGGIQRGKNDMIDSERIMTYAYRNQDKVVSFKAKDTKIQQIADYLSLRSRFQKCIKSLKVPIKELRSVGLQAESESLEVMSRESIKAMQKELKALDEKILNIIMNDEELSKQYKLITSVRCVGFVAASHLMIYTDGFTRFTTSKQLAAYAGIAPFEYSSGTSVRGRTKVHPMANKILKTILHMCAISSVRYNPEMKAYFERKVAEGKNKMLVINAIRNKIVGRVFSCVKNNRMYTENYAT